MRRFTSDTGGVMVALSGKEIVTVPLAELDKNGSNIDLEIYKLAYDIAT